jgi:hypothetical protein
MVVLLLTTDAAPLCVAPVAVPSFIVRASQTRTSTKSPACKAAAVVVDLWAPPPATVVAVSAAGDVTAGRVATLLLVLLLLLPNKSGCRQISVSKVRASWIFKERNMIGLGTRLSQFNGQPQSSYYALLASCAVAVRRTRDNNQTRNHGFHRVVLSLGTVPA